MTVLEFVSPTMGLPILSAIYNNVTVIIGSLLLLLVLRFIGYALYNVTLHPLASYPGPKSAAASYIPQFIARGKGNITYVKKLHDQYGSVVRIAPNELSFTNPQAWRGYTPFKSHLSNALRMLTIVDRHLRACSRPEAVAKADHCRPTQ